MVEFGLESVFKKDWLFLPVRMKQGNDFIRLRTFEDWDKKSVQHTLDFGSSVILQYKKKWFSST